MNCALSLTGWSPESPGRSLEFLFSVLDRLFEVPLTERIRIEGVENATTLALKDGTLVSVIVLEGSQGMLGPDEFAADAEAIRISLSPFLAGPGHAIEVSFSRDPRTARRVLEASVNGSRRRAAELGLDLGGILTERQRRLGGLLAAETCLLAVRTSPPVRSAGQSNEGRNHDGDGERARHDTLTDALCRAFRARNMDAKVLDAVGALREIRASVHPLTAPWKADWTPNGPESDAAVRFPRQPFGLDFQIASESLEIVDQRLVRIGDVIFSAFDVTVGPEVLKPFNELVDAVTSAQEPFPWRCSFLLEPAGLDSLRLKEQYAKLLAFAAPVRNGRIRDTMARLREIDGSQDVVVRLRMSFATWAEAGEEARLRRSAAALGRAVEQWGNISVDGVSGDPAATALSTAVSLAADSTAPAAAAPMSDALALLPLGRQACPWDSGPVLFRTDDRRIWPYLPGSSLQNSWVEIHAGSSGSGKSVAMNAINLASILAAQAGEGGRAELPRMAIIDIGHSSKGLVDLLRESLPASRAHEVAHLKLKMTPAHAVNPFDTSPGMRAPNAAGRSFLVNFLSVLAGGGQDGPRCPMTGLIGAAVDQAYRQLSDRERPRRHVAGEEPEVDEALERIGFEFGEFTTWWETADALFLHRRLRQAGCAQSRAVPVLSDLIDASHADQIEGLYRNARMTDGGESVLQAFRRVVSEAVRDLPVLAGCTRFNPGHARIIALDLDEVVAGQFGGESRRQASLMFMLARQLLIRDWLLDEGEAAVAVGHGVLPKTYLDHHCSLAALGKRTPKLFAMDEFHRCGGLPGFRRQILQDVREGRKNNIRVALSSQVMEDFGDDILDAATSVFIFDAPSEGSVGRIARLFGLGDHERSILRARLNGPGRDGAPLFAVIRHKGGTSTQKLNLTLGGAELWALSTTAEDVALRERLYRRFSVSDALLLLAARFPGGSAKAEVERIAARSIRGDGADRGPATRSGAIETLADELAREFGSDLRARMEL